MMRPIVALSQEEQEVSPGFQGLLFEAPTFLELSEWFLQRLQPVDARKQTRKNQETTIRHALEWLQKEGIERPITADWKRYLDWRRNPECPRRLSGQSAESARAIICRVYSRCQKQPKREWAMVSNPADAAFLGVWKPKNRGLPRSVADVHVTYPLILKAMPDVRAQAFVALQRWHGLRVQEAAAVILPGSELEKSMGRRFLDVNAGTLRIEWQRTRDSWTPEPLKTEFSADTIKLAPEPLRLLRAALKEYQEAALNPTPRWLAKQGKMARNYVFPFYRLHLDRLMDIHRQVAPGDFRKRVVGVHGGDAWHAWRHTALTELYRSLKAANLPKEHVEERIHKAARHRDRKTTDNYLRALLVEPLAGEDLDEAWRIQEEAQAQALAERSGKGLLLVKNGGRP